MVQYRKGEKNPWRIQVRDASGQRRSFTFHTKEDAREAEVKKARERQRIRAGLERPVTEVLLFDFSAAWLRKRIETGMPTSTTEADESKLRRIWLPRFGARLLSSLQAPEIAQVLDEMLLDGVKYQDKRGKEKTRKVSPATRNRHRALLHTLFEAAVEAGHIATNPIARIPVLSEKRKTRRTRGWSDAESGEKYITGMYAESVVAGVFATAQLWGGTRANATLALNWGDIDFAAKKFHVTKIVEIASGALKERTKGLGDGGHEVYPLLERLERALTEWKSKTTYTGAFDPIFHDGTGSRLSYWHFEGLHHKVIVRLELERITIHGLRHMFATNAEKAGLKKGEVQKLLGHRNIATTEKYTHVDIEHVSQRAREVGFGAADGWDREKSERLERIRALSLACDRWSSPIENMRAIALTLEAIRGIERWGSSELMERAFTGFAALPAPETKKHWREVLGFMGGSTVIPAQVKAAFRELAARHHPDRGGDPVRMAEINRAYDDACKELGA